MGKREPEGTRFRDLYRQMEQSRPEETPAEREDMRLTISSADMPLSSFLRWIADRTRASIICDQSLDAAPVTIDVIDTPLADILSAVARRLNVDLTQQGNLYYMGTLKPEDRGVLVRKVRRLDADNLQRTVEVLLSDMGRAASYSDGLLVVGDRVRVLQRIHAMLDQVEAAESNTWIVQLYLISAQDSFSRELGLDTETSLDMAATFAAGARTRDVSGALSAMLKATRTTGKASIVAQPLMLLLDGGNCSFQDGDTIPIPQKTVSDSGTVTTSGYEYVNTGLIIASSLREVSPVTAKCQLDIQLTSITGYVGDAPVVNGQKFSTTAVLDTGGVYLLGSLTRRQKQRDTQGSLFPTLFAASKSGGDIQVWLRCFRIAGPLPERSHHAE